MVFFSELTGNEKLKNTAAADIFAGTPSHAYIVEGPDGSGKHTAAKLIASAFFCERRDPDRFPCGKCLPCRKVREGICTDVITVNRGKNASIGVDVIRELRSTLDYAPVEMEQKVYMIEEADKMTPAAQNSLLLSLEEPPEFVKFVLLCADSSLLLETVRSRAPVIAMELFSSGKISEYLSEMPEYKQFANSSDLFSAAAASEGSIGKAMALLADRNAPELKEAALCRKIMPVLLSGTLAERTALIKELPAKREEILPLIKSIGTALRDVLACKKSEEAPMLFYTSREEASELCPRATVKRLLKLSRSAADAYQKIKANVNIQAVMTLLMTVN